MTVQASVCEGGAVSSRESTQGKAFHLEKGPARFAPEWGDRGTEPTVEQQLAEARFLAEFCRAIYAERDPRMVCATAAQSLYDYFGYRLAQFSFVDDGLETVAFMPKRGGDAREGGDVSPVELPILKKRRLSLAGANGEGIDITVRFPTGMGQLRIVEVEEETREVTTEFLQTIAECLATALDTAIEHTRLQELSLRDGLTGLLNRRAFEELLDIEEERRDPPPLSVVMIDIDDFKAVNDRYGHPAGDQVISGIGRAIVEALRGADLAARYGGEEFAVLLPGTVVKDAFAVAERLRARIGALSFEFGGHPVSISASIGVANRVAKEDCTVRELLKFADQALYEAKKRGKNRTLIQDISAAAPTASVRRVRKRRQAALAGPVQ